MSNLWMTHIDEPFFDSPGFPVIQVHSTRESALRCCVQHALNIMPPINESMSPVWVSFIEDATPVEEKTTEELEALYARVVSIFRETRVVTIAEIEVLGT